VHTHGVAKGQRRKGRPLPTRHATCWGVFNMILACGLFFIVGMIAENYTLMVGSLLLMLLGVLIEK
jgi:hypothetical protein